MLVFISRATRLPVFDKSYTTLFVKLLSKKMVAAKKKLIGDILQCLSTKLSFMSIFI